MVDIDPARLDEFLAQLDITPGAEAHIEIRSAARREIEMRLLPWEKPVMTRHGPEVVLRGAFDETDPSKVVLLLEHEKPPAGKGISYENRPDGPYMTFKVSKTQRGDDILTLAEDGVTNGVSVGYRDTPEGVKTYSRGGKRIRVVERVALEHVATTHLPTWGESAILAIRSQEEIPVSEAPVVEAPAAPAPVPQSIDFGPITDAIRGQGDAMTRALETFAERVAALEERSRQEIVIPGHSVQEQGANRGDWMQAVLRMLSGERVPELQMRALADLVTTDNLGVVPPAYSQEIIGVIDPRRPFMQTTRRVPTPDSGMGLIMPKIVTRPTVATQAAEKDELASTATSITTVTYNAITKGGAGDISLQLLKRSSPSFLSLYLELLAEAYAIETEDEAIDQLLAAGITDGGTLDPENASFGDAWANAAASTRRGPDTIWLSSSAVGAFINAKANTTNVPLYSDLRADFTAAGGVGGNISGLRPVWVPALDDETADVVIGPSQGFAWAEDGTYTLQVDVPAKAGRDVAIVGITWFAPIYPTAFTKYALGS